MRMYPSRSTAPGARTNPSRAIFGRINTAFKFAECAVHIAEFGTESEIFVRTVQVVRNDLREVERLVSVDSVWEKVLRTPEKDSWIDQAIHNTRASLNDIGKWVERARVDHQAVGIAKFETTVRRMFSDHERLLNRKVDLQTCHQQLSNVIRYLMDLERECTRLESPSYHHTICFDDLVSPRQRRQRMLESRPVTTVVPAYERPARKPLPASAGTPSEMCLPSLSFTSRGLPPTDMFPATPSPESPRETTAMYSTKPFPALYNAPSRSLSDSITIEGTAALQGVKGSADSLTYETQSGKWKHRQMLGQTADAELPGDNVDLSANNSGPVSPFELLGDLSNCERRTEKQTAQHEGHRYDCVELMGDISFPNELPDNRMYQQYFSTQRNLRLAWQRATNSPVLPTSTMRPESQYTQTFDTPPPAPEHERQQPSRTSQPHTALEFADEHVQYGEVRPWSQSFDVTTNSIRSSQSSLSMTVFDSPSPRTPHRSPPSVFSSPSAMSLRPESTSEQSPRQGQPTSPPRRQAIPHTVTVPRTVTLPVPQNAAFNRMQQQKKLIDLLDSINQE